VLKINSKHCELIKLCRINRSGPVFFRHSVVNVDGGFSGQSIQTESPTMEIP